MADSLSFNERRARHVAGLFQGALLSVCLCLSLCLSLTCNLWLCAIGLSNPRMPVCIFVLTFIFVCVCRGLLFALLGGAGAFVPLFECLLCWGLVGSGSSTVSIGRGWEQQMAPTPCFMLLFSFVVVVVVDAVSGTVECVPILLAHLKLFLVYCMPGLVRCLFHVAAATVAATLLLCRHQHSAPMRAHTWTR